MSRSAREDTVSFGVILFVILWGCALVSGSAGVFWVMFSMIPVYILASGLDNR